MKTNSMPRRWRVTAGPRAQRTSGGVAIRRYRLVPLERASKARAKTVTA